MHCYRIEENVKFKCFEPDFADFPFTFLFSELDETSKNNWNVSASLLFPFYQRNYRLNLATLALCFSCTSMQTGFLYQPSTSYFCFLIALDSLSLLRRQHKKNDCVCRCLSFSTDPSLPKAPLWISLSSFFASSAVVAGNCHSNSTSPWPQRNSTFTRDWPEQEPAPGSSARHLQSSTFSRNPILDGTSEIGISQILHKHFQILTKTKQCI